MASHNPTMPEWLTAEYMRKVLKGHVNFRVETIEVTPGSKVGDNYSSQILRISIKGKQSEESISLIGKLKLDTEFVKSIEQKGDIFLNEVKFFVDLLPTLRSLISFDFVPKHYETDLERNIIFLEDLTAKGYKTVSRGQYLDLGHCQQTIDALATFHGASYYAIDKNPRLKDNFKNHYWTREKNEPSLLFFKNAYEAIEANIDKYGLSETHKKKLLAIKEVLYAEWFQACELKEGQLNFLLHGDCWTNNLMFHYQNETADGVKLIDFQLINYGSFANDLISILFTSADISVLFNDLDYLLERYFNKLRNVAPSVRNLTLKQVKDEFAERYRVGLLMTIMFRPLFLCENPPDPDELYQGATNSCFAHPMFIAEVPQLMDFFEKLAVF